MPDKINNSFTQLVSESLKDQFNYDAMTTEDLFALQKEIRALRIHLESLELYVNAKARAQQLRLEGDIPRAINLENYADQTYKQLPDFLRW